MLLNWVGRAVGDRFGPARLLALVIGPAYLLLETEATLGWADWAVVLAAGVLFLAGGVWPLTVAVGESLLVVVAHMGADPTPAAIATKVIAGVALFELAIRRPLPHALAALAVQTVVYYLVVPYDPTVTGVLSVAYRLVCVAGAPMLLGAYLRAGVQALTAERARAEDAEERRELVARGARQAERTEIARELHDLVAHHVASMALRVGVARAVVPDLDPRVAAVLDDVHSSAKTTLTDLRRLVSMLREPATAPDATRSVLVDPAELPAAVTAVIDRSARAGLRVEQHVDPAVATLDSVRGLAVLRLVQEGLTNVTKHAGPDTEVTVRVAVADGDVVVEVTDDGGRPHLPSTGPGYGLIGLRERMTVVGGVLTAGPSGDGWRLRARLPTATELEVTG